MQIIRNREQMRFRLLTRFLVVVCVWMLCGIRHDVSAAEKEMISAYTVEAEEYTEMSGITREEGQISNCSTNDWMRYKLDVEKAAMYRILAHGCTEGTEEGQIVFRNEEGAIALITVGKGETEAFDAQSEALVLAEGEQQLTAIAVSGMITLDSFEVIEVSEIPGADDKEEPAEKPEDGKEEPAEKPEDGKEEPVEKPEDGKEEPSEKPEDGKEEPVEKPEDDKESPEELGKVEVPEVDDNIPTKKDKIVFQFNNKTGGAYADDEIYWCILGYDWRTNKLCYVDAQGNLLEAKGSLNTIQKGDRWCAKIYNTLAENEYVYMPSIRSGRMYISYGSPVYITINEDSNGNIGFAGPDLNNPSDPNADVLFEFLEFTIGSNVGGANQNLVEYWGNTTRVDNFCFPVVTRLIGEKGETNGQYYEVYDKTVGDVGSREGLFREFRESAPAEFKELAGEHRIIAPCKGSFNEGKANANYFKAYIDEFWNKYAKEDLKFQCQGGDFVARTSGNVINFTETRSGQKGTVNKPNTQEVLEGKGAFDRGSSIEKVFEAQLCAAFNRGVACHPENWYTPSAYYPEGTPYNYYSKFWHEHSVNGFAYGFCYDDVNEQATLLHFTKPTSLVIDLKW